MISPHGKSNFPILTYVILILISTVIEASLIFHNDILQQTTLSEREKERLQGTYLGISDVSFEAGDILTSSNGVMFFAMDATSVIYMDVQREYATFRHVYAASLPEEYIRSHLKDNPFGENKGVRLAEVFVGKKVPYKTKTCNQYHYMDYFYLGRVRDVQHHIFSDRKSMSSDCPLWRKNFSSVQTWEFSQRDFYLQTSKGAAVYPSDWETAPPISAISPISSNSRSLSTKGTARSNTQPRRPLTVSKYWIRRSLSTPVSFKRTKSFLSCFL
ncbi:unnamed protein product [Bemisia tabaci]|uniref:Uncharacterized protein n=1 Tax=Bemisia tabaci TaxID=7038 RepID=A0A9P0F594_BEMTA|nr:unnamed protein product [Bemisia tabaci]